MTTERQQIETAIAALEAQRATLGDTVLELATAPLRAQLASLLRELVVLQQPAAPAQEAEPAECEAGCAHHRPARLGWAKLLKRALAAT